MFRYGFELEAFYKPEDTIILPPAHLPVDGFPGLVEIRTEDHDTLEKAYFNLLKEASRIGLDKLSFVPEHTFSAEQKRELRRTRTICKDQVDVQSLYGKKPRDLKGKTLASFQINISNLRHDSRTISRSKDGVTIEFTEPERFNLLDVPKIVRALDDVFALDIKLSKRQPGEYCIKGDRLEYRSAPNLSACLNVHEVASFLEKIRKAVEGK